MRTMKMRRRAALAITLCLGAGTVTAQIEPDPRRCSEQDFVFCLDGVRHTTAYATPKNAEYGQDGIFLGVPCKLGEGGIEEIIQLDLTDEEQKQLEGSAEAVRSVLATVQ